MDFRSTPMYDSMYGSTKSMHVTNNHVWRAWTSKNVSMYVCHECRMQQLCLSLSFLGALLQHVAACCSAMLCVAACCSALQCVAVYCSVLPCVAKLRALSHRRCVFQCVATLRTVVLQCVAVCCSVLQCVAVCCSVLQCVAVCCSVLCVCSNVLQR